MSVLQRLLASARRSLAERRTNQPLAAVVAQAAAAPAPRPFAAALRGEHIRLIAEVKRASPSRGLLRADLDPAGLARQYEAGGAHAISVLTEAEHFQGSLEDLSLVRQASGLPLLRKDFVVDEYQVYEARAHGADALLLIVAVLSPDQLRHLLALARALGMEALVETHTAAEVQTALVAGARVVGINNRNLADFAVDLATTEALRPLIPPEVVVVSESGLRSAADVQRVWAAGADAILVGEELVTSADPAARIQELLQW